MIKKALLIACWLCILSGPAQAVPLSIACAANFTSAMKELATLYQNQTSTSVHCTFGSTGMLYGQILNGAPYALFFAADEKRPALLHKAGLANQPKVYARGRVVLWTRNEALTGLPNWKEVVASGDVDRIGIANPKTAPYGQIAFSALTTSDLLPLAEPKLAYGKNVGMTFQFAYSKAADIAFVALSQALSEEGALGTHWSIPEAGPVNQSACAILGKGETEASAFLQWMNSAPAQAVIRRYGYE